MFKIVKTIDVKGSLKFDKFRSKSVEEFIDNNVFNIEDKLFLNRLAYLTFKKKGANATFDNFL